MRWVTSLLLGSLLFLVLGCQDATEVRKDYYANGTLKSELTYFDGQLNGVCTWYFPNGKPQLEAGYKDNKMDGQLRRWYENGNLMEECWYKGGVQDSVSRTYFLVGGLASEGYYVDGMLNGEFKRWFDNGHLFQEGQYVDDMMDGHWMIFYADGNLAATAEFDKGAGTQTSYEHSGYKCLVTNYLDNVKHGKETYFNPDGKVTRVAVYEYGEWVGDE